jgi:hypothetical protein
MAGQRDHAVLYQIARRYNYQDLVFAILPTEMPSDAFLGRASVRRASKRGNTVQLVVKTTSAGTALPAKRTCKYGSAMHEQMPTFQLLISCNVTRAPRSNDDQRLLESVC